MEARRRLVRLRAAMGAAALANLVLGLAGEAAGPGVLRSLGFDEASAFVWGILYGITIAMVAVRPKRIMITIVSLALIDGTRLVFAAGDAGGSPPWIALLLRAGFAALGVAAAFAGHEAAEEAAWARQPPQYVARIARPAGARPPGEVPPRPSRPAASVPRPASSPLPGVPRVTDSLLTTGSRTAAVSVRAPSTKVDSVAAVMQFVAKRCEIDAEGVKGTTSAGLVRVLRWSDVRALWVRALPPDPPWNGQLVFDVVPSSGEPIRVFATTIVHWPEGGRPPTSRLEYLRRIGAHVVSRSPGLSMDDETRAFVEAGAPVRSLARYDDLAARDEGYGGLASGATQGMQADQRSGRG